MVTLQLKDRELLCDDLTFCDDQLSDCSENPAPDYAAFLQHTFNIFKNGLDRDLYRQEQELTVSYTVKFQNFRTPEIFAVIYQKF